jgi:hypothetical protein
MAMLRNRLLIFAGICFLAASAAKADGVAYIDCASHPDDTQVFGKPRRTPESVAALPCGERFTILLYGFIFSRIQTKDGQVGYIYSSLISADHSGASVQQPAATRTPAASSKAAVTTASVAPPSATAPAQAQATIASSAQPTPAPAPAATPKLPDAATVVQLNSTPVVTAEPAMAPTASAQGSAATPRVSETAASAVPSTPAASAQAPAGSTAAQIEGTAPAASVREAPAEAAQPEAAPAAQPEPEAARPQPAAPAIRSVSMKESWEKPNPGVRTVGLPRLPLIELFGGYGFARLDGGGGSFTNTNGVLGSFGWNIKPWLQIVADSSYSVVTVNGVKNTLYGNHWGPRIFRRVRNRWGATPFVEALVGGSRADTSVSGTGGYSTSNIGLSYKIGGGVDLHPTRHFEIRVVDFDYYRTSFGTNLHQNNYFVSAGIVLRLFGGRSE